MLTPELKPVAPPLRFGPATAVPIQTLLAGCRSPHTARSYQKAITELDLFAEGRDLTRLLLLDWRTAMERKLAPSTVNLRLTGARKLIQEARRSRTIDADHAADLLDVPNVSQRGIRAGNWLTTAQARELLAVPSPNSLRGKRNACVLAILLGCGLRRFELSLLTVDHLQMRDDRWIIENLRGKGGRVRSVAVPGFVKDAIAAWMYAAEIRSGRIVRQLNLAPEGVSEQTIWDIVSKAAARIGVHNFTPHDLRRTCAKLCRKNGGELEQIQFMLGHASLVTTERYLGGTQNLTHAVNDNLGF